MAGLEDHRRNGSGARGLQSDAELPPLRRGRNHSLPLESPLQVFPFICSEFHSALTVSLDGSLVCSDEFERHTCTYRHTCACPIIVSLLAAGLRRLASAAGPDDLCGGVPSTDRCANTPRGLAPRMRRRELQVFTPSEVYAAWRAPGRSCNMLTLCPKPFLSSRTFLSWGGNLDPAAASGVGMSTAGPIWVPSSILG